MKVLWSQTALSQLQGIYDYIGETSPLYAELMLRRIWARGGQLESFPESGRAVPEYQEPSLREVLELPYRIIYRVDPERVEVLAVVHVRRSSPSLEP